MGAGTGPLPEIHVLLLVLLAVDVRPFRDTKKEENFKTFFSIFKKKHAYPSSFANRARDVVTIRYQSRFCCVFLRKNVER